MCEKGSLIQVHTDRSYVVGTGAFGVMPVIPFSRPDDSGAQVTRTLLYIAAWECRCCMDAFQAELLAALQATRFLVQCLVEQADDGGC